MCRYRLNHHLMHRHFPLWDNPPEAPPSSPPSKPPSALPEAPPGEPLSSPPGASPTVPREAPLSSPPSRPPPSEPPPPSSPLGEAECDEDSEVQLLLLFTRSAYVSPDLNLAHVQRLTAVELAADDSTRNTTFVNGSVHFVKDLSYVESIDEYRRNGLGKVKVQRDLRPRVSEQRGVR